MNRWMNAIQLSCEWRSTTNECFCVGFTVLVKRFSSNDSASRSKCISMYLTVYWPQPKFKSNSMLREDSAASPHPNELEHFMHYLAHLWSSCNQKCHHFWWMHWKITEFLFKVSEQLNYYNLNDEKWNECNIHQRHKPTEVVLAKAPIRDTFVANFMAVSSVLWMFQTSQSVFNVKIVRCTT